MQVVLYKFLHEPEPTQTRTVLGLGRQGAQQRQAVLRARQRTAIATSACTTISYI